MRQLVYQSPQGRVSVKTSAQVIYVGLALFAVLALIFCFSLQSGSYDLPVAELFDALAGRDGSPATTVIWQLRLPRFATACLVGAAFALSGALLQSVTRNPLADPSLVGVSQGASLAVVAMIILWPEGPVWVRPFAAFAGGIGAAVMVQTIAAGRQNIASLRFILVGIGVAALISSATSALLTYGQINLAMSALGWLAGSVHTATWGTVQILLLCLAASAPLLVWAARPVAALRFGNEAAIAFGVGLPRARFGVITLAVALAGFAVSASGPMGFIGLIAPQLALRLAPGGAGSRLLLSALTGACLVTFADLVGRTIAAPIQLPAGLVSALLGAPLFLFLVVQRGRTRSL